LILRGDMYPLRRKKHINLLMGDLFMKRTIQLLQALFLRDQLWKRYLLQRIP